MKKQTLRQFLILYPAPGKIGQRYGRAEGVDHKAALNEMFENAAEFTYHGYNREGGQRFKLGSAEITVFETNGFSSYGY